MVREVIPWPVRTHRKARTILCLGINIRDDPVDESTCSQHWEFEHGKSSLPQSSATWLPFPHPSPSMPKAGCKVDPELIAVGQLPLCQTTCNTWESRTYPLQGSTIEPTMIFVDTGVDEPDMKLYAWETCPHCSSVLGQHEWWKFTLSLAHRYQMLVGDLALWSLEQESCPWPTLFVKLRRPGPAPHQRSTIEPTLFSRLCVRQPWICEHERTVPICIKWHGWGKDIILSFPPQPIHTCGRR